MLVDEKKVDKGTRALKRRRIHKVFASTPADVSFEGILSAKLPNLLTIEAAKEAGEGSSYAGALQLDVADLLQVNMTFRSHSKSSQAFKGFAKLVSTKLDIPEITSTRVERSFIFGYQSMVLIRTFSSILSPYFF